jgi:hypothetical protein
MSCQSPRKGVANCHSYRAGHRGRQDVGSLSVNKIPSMLTATATTTRKTSNIPGSRRRCLRTTAGPLPRCQPPD